MPKISNSEDVYRKLVEESEEDWLYGLVAFAILEEKRINWMRHITETTTTTPDGEKIIEWYEGQPPEVLQGLKGEAEGALSVYAQEILDADNKEERKKIADGQIVQEIRMGRRFWPQFGVNLAGGLASAVIFAATLITIYFTVTIDPSPIKIGNYIINPPNQGEN